MANKAKDKSSKFWEFIYDMHLYEGKGEGVFKAFIISFSWIGGVHMASIPTDITINIAASLFLFSIALIMEYLISLIFTDKNSTRIFPFLIVVISSIISFITFGQLADRPFNVSLDILYIGTIIPQLIIWFDVITYLWLGNPYGCKAIESTLKNMEV